MSAALSAQQVGSNTAPPRFGIIDSYTAAMYKVKVVLCPTSDGKTPMTGSIQVLSPWIGDLWGFIAPPMPLDQGVVVSIQNNADESILVGRFYDKNHRPPLRADGMPFLGGEMGLVHKLLSRVQFTNDGKALINGQVELDLNSNALVVITAPNVTINGDVQVNGKLTATGEITANGGHTVSAHRHGGVSIGGAQTATPTG